MTDSSAVLVDGPWQHRFVAANGARFHVAEATPDGDGSHAPLVVLLHGFPQTWWAWRHLLPVLAAAGYRVAAMDLRGSGASDKPPQGYDVPTLARDVAGVVRSLGAHEAVVVGHGLGGVVAWSMPALQPEMTRAVAALSTPHPARLHAPTVLGACATRTTARRLALFQLPYVPERMLTRGELTTRVLAEWGAPGWLRADVAHTYRMSMQIPFAAHSAMEQLRWLVRSTPRVDGQRYFAAVRQPVRVPVLHLHGDTDRCLPSRVVLEGAVSDAGAPYRAELVAGAGHFLPEEAPERVGDLLVGWLDALGPGRA